MSTKRKVQFSNTKRVKKITQEHNSESDQSDEERDSKPKPKHTLDSDEEDNTDNYKPLNKECLHDIGQEAKTKDFDDEIKLTPFNMKDELDDGNFDTDGFYHWKSNKDDLKDAWLDNIEWANVNTFKNKYSLQENVEEEDSETEEKVESDSESDNPKDDETVQFELFKKIVTHLKPGETVLKAIKRLGDSSKLCVDNKSKVGLSASQRWCKKKAPVQQKNKTADPEQAKADRESLDLLSGYANHFIDKGFYDIYEETYEKLNYRITNQEKSKAPDPFDMFADDIEDVAASTSGNKSNLVEDSIVKWVYKTENTEEAK